METLEDVIKELNKKRLTSSKRVVVTTEISWNNSPWAHDKHERVVSIDEERKYAKFYDPYNQLAPAIPDLRPIIDYLSKNGYRTNLD